ncbi:MAG: HisA/HisF-related TIM barrel protein [Candidatus Eremiobacteraeota bacterium]|nr:HisA/HisF-related TIM barrel protein [Candidatus Eremiobacteraeota bacterium]
MILIPAIDLRKGKCVRMHQGDPNRETQYEADPVEQARVFVAAGAQRLHVIDLDGAFGIGQNLAAIESICAAVDVPVESGGGVRTLDQAKARLAAGAAYVVLGTVLVENERGARNIIGTLGDQVIAGVDARGDRVAIRGWLSETVMGRDALIKRVASWGVGRVIFTEIARDGTGKGYDIAALKDVARVAQIKITASGGARTIGDLRSLKDQTPDNVDSAIIGRALYEDTIDLSAAISELA